MVYFKLYSVIALAIAVSAVGVNAAAIGKRASCSAINDQFSPNSDIGQNWGGQLPAGSYALGGDGLEMRVLNPSPKKVGDGPTFISNSLIQYGYVEARIKSAPVNGLVTSFIFRAPNGDEIDWEWVANEAQTSYYYHGIDDYTTEGSTVVPDDSSNFHTYAINWQPDSITWYIDGVAQRTVTKESTNQNGVYHYPTAAANVELGLWDSSFDKSTAAWAHGPVDWSKQPAYVSAYVQYVKVTC
ncbi:hypothetical protein INT43_007923 [Umbelopsis isabellina]|uniref:GH16 domain-containing protein n=1 Tax=Mortierella isabellina TaxID=91625 RepID=A0A8H7PNM8_MORIS|nr:hypothetical protein INT43_007923 [Umbelopsis isabellina]